MTINFLSSALIYLWLGVLGLLILWLLVRRWRANGQIDALDTAVSPSSVVPFNQQSHQPIITTMLFTGLLLLILGQISLGSLPSEERWQVGSLMILGGGLFLWAGSRVRPDGLAEDWLARRLHALGHRFGLAGWQVLLLILAAGLSWLASLAAGELPVARRWDVSVAAWLLALGFALAGGVTVAEWRHWLWRGVKIARWEWLFLLGLVVAAWLLRGTAVTQFPNTFSGDEGSSGLHAVRFVQGEADNWFTTGWFSFPSFYYALQSLFIDLFGQTVEALRYFSALGGTLAVLATYFLARVMFDRGTAVAAAVVMMGSHYHIHLSRIGLNNVWDSLFVAVTLAGVWYGWRSGKRLPWLLAGLSLGVGQYFYVSIRVLPLLLLIWGAGLWWRQPEAWRARLSDFLLSGYTAVLAILPLSIYYAGNWAEFQAPLVRVTILGERLANMASAEQLSQPIIVMRQMGQTALGFTYLPLRLLYDPGVPLLLPLAGALFLTGLAWLLLRFNSRAALLLLPLLSVILLGGFSQDPPASQRFILALPSVAVLVALPIGLLGGWLGQMWPDRKILAWGGTAVLLSWLLFIDITFYFGTLYDTYILGGLNTVVATEIAQDLQQEPEKPDVFFLGFPRMGYYSLSTIPYLVPEVEAVDLTEPLTAPPAWEIEQTTWVLFLPERLEEFQYVQEAFPNGRYDEVIDDQDRLLYAVYRLEP